MRFAPSLNNGSTFAYLRNIWCFVRGPRSETEGKTGSPLTCSACPHKDRDESIFLGLEDRGAGFCRIVPEHSGIVDRDEQTTVCIPVLQSARVLLTAAEVGSSLAIFKPLIIGFAPTHDSY
jgi:hypothetical protein